MNSRLLAALAIVPFVISGCAGTGSPTTRSAAADAVVIPLQATRINAGNVGQATLLPLDGNTSILLDFTGVPGDTTLPVHVYTYIYEAGCGALPTKPAYALNERVIATKRHRRLGRPLQARSHDAAANERALERSILDRPSLCACGRRSGDLLRRGASRLAWPRHGPRQRARLRGPFSLTDRCSGRSRLVRLAVVADAFREDLLQLARLAAHSAPTARRCHRPPPRPPASARTCRCRLRSARRPRCARCRTAGSLRAGARRLVVEDAVPGVVAAVASACR